VAELSQINDLMALLERRVALLSVLRSALEEPSVYLRIGEENETPALRSISIVAANYGLPGRNLGAVSVLGPVRMDYPTAIAAVRRAADELSRFAVELYE
jgi:heat-inducible transcriptional repressor